MIRRTIHLPCISWFLDLEYLALQPVAFFKNFSSPLPPIPRPPPKLLPERHRLWFGTATRSLLEQIAFVAVALFKKTSIQMII